MYKRSGVQSLPTPNWLVSWSDNKELLSKTNAISWNLLKKKKKVLYSRFTVIALSRPDKTCDITHYRHVRSTLKFFFLLIHLLIIKILSCVKSHKHLHDSGCFGLSLLDHRIFPPRVSVLSSVIHACWHKISILSSILNMNI